MSYSKPYLKDFIFYCENEQALLKKRSKNKCKVNYDKFLNNIKEQKRNPEILARYNKNIEKAHELIDSRSYYHNTSVNSLMSILENRYLFSINEMERRDVSFNYLISYRGINEEMFKYVFLRPKGDWIYGLCEIEFIKDIEFLEHTFFLPKSNLLIPEYEIDNNVMTFNKWKHYLEEIIAINFEDPGDYFSITPTPLQPEFLIPQKISLDYIKKIKCKGKSTYDDVCSLIQNMFKDTRNYLNILSYEE